MPKRREHPFFKRNGFWYGYTNAVTGKRQAICLDVRAKGRDDFGSPELSSAQLIRFDKILKSKVDELLFQQEETTIEDALARVIKYVSANREPKTVATYKKVHEHFKDLCIRERINYLSDLNPEFLATYAGEKRSEGRKRSGINSDLQTVRATLNLLHGWGIMPQEFVSRVWFKRAFFSKQKRRERTYSETELRVLLKDKLYGDVFTALYLLGCRVGVLGKLHTSNIGDKVISLPRGKGGALHDIPISDQFRDFNSQHTPTSEQGSLVWRDKFGDPNDDRALANFERSIGQRLKRVLKNNSFKDGRVHDFRATCIIMLRNAGMDSLDIAEYIGIDIKTLQDHYFRRDPKDIIVPDLPAVRSSKLKVVGE